MDPTAPLALSRPLAPGGDDTLVLANLEIRPSEYQVFADGRRVNFTLREFQTFMVLAERPDRVVPRPAIYELVWGASMTHRNRSVDVFVRKVRGKLASAAPGWEYIHTHFGIGYRFAPLPRPQEPNGSFTG